MAMQVNVITSTEYFLLFVKEIKFVEVDQGIVGECSLLFGVFVGVEHSGLDVIFGMFSFNIGVHSCLLSLCIVDKAPLNVIDVILDVFKCLS